MAPMKDAGRWYRRLRQGRRSPECSARRRCYAPLRFSNHILAVSERDRAHRAHGRARRFEISLQAVSAERAFVDLRREALVIVLRNNERTRLHARAAADAAVLVEHH